MVGKVLSSQPAETVPPAQGFQTPTGSQIFVFILSIEKESEEMEKAKS